MTGTAFRHLKIFGDVNKTVYHYISPSTFEKVISNKELWFSRCDCLNDYEDGKVLEVLYKDCLDDLYMEKKVSPEFYEAAKQIEIEHFAWRIEGDRAYHLPCKPFVCCFSQKEDSLQMWQYYSKVGNYEGYNIGFSPAEMLDIDVSYFNIGKVLYGEKEQKERIVHVIATIYKNYCTDLELGIMDKRKLLIRHITIMRSELAKLACFFKRECFAGEEEIRIVLEVPNDPKYRDKLWMKQKDGDYPIPIKYRINHALMIPYIVVNYNPDSIKSVMIGPVTSSKDNSMKKNKEVIEEYLYDKLGRRVSVSSSAIPVRY